VKRLIIICQIVIVILFIIKISFLTEATQNTSVFSPFSLGQPGHASAETPMNVSAKALKDVTDDGLQKERDLLSLLQQKQIELDAKESSLKSEEQKILALKKEIMEKIDVLKLLEARLSPKLDTEKANDAKRFKELAKVYEAAPPQKAAAMLEKLEVKKAAGITINMKRERAGLVWGYLSPQKAVDITNEITRTAPSSTN
jgi:flagellar motility protein MotE (MotC chaperone)